MNTPYLHLVTETPAGFTVWATRAQDYSQYRLVVFRGTGLHQPEFPLVFEHLTDTIEDAQSLHRQLVELYSEASLRMPTTEIRKGIVSNDARSLAK